ncbi:MAG: hypothetical protein RIE06_01785 [Roseibium album]|uniref:hypothetical protein n=1 Tax=Roseibium album TaxID=311410 RepID=UPI0032F003F8
MNLLIDRAEPNQTMPLRITVTGWDKAKQTHHKASHGLIKWVFPRSDLFPAASQCQMKEEAFLNSQCPSE